MSKAAPPIIVVVDDDDLFRPLLVGNLREAEYEVSDFPAPDALLQHLKQNVIEADLFILDWKMPGMTGFELLKELRDLGIATPALFLTSLDDVLYEESALREGAADFVGKTRSFAILRHRIERILGALPANPSTSPAAPANIGALTLDSAQHRVTWRDKVVELTLGEFRAVELLATSGRDVSYREIYDTMRGENFIAGAGPEGYRANVRALVKRIRQKFTEADSGFTAIENYPGYGYRWKSGNA
ncbi:response regulator transcription factor [Dongia soli]|uniref:Response regulator transcription factor n=1 Tax=Dongia soli TaxID=600628 RepID=A0ABU5E4J2_9PROT|nr:response regulator transcription factor [Dongia soli]MDY0881230.1 response regulator transcription factor [Dongia soli]